MMELILGCLFILLVGEWKERHDAEMNLPCVVLGDGEPFIALHSHQLGIQHALFIDLASFDDLDNVIY